MIVVTVGSDIPFDRLVHAVDVWAGERGRSDVMAQIGRSVLRPRFIRHTEFIEPPEFDRLVASAALVVGHAGMGTILTALRHRTPVLVMPRRASLNETRNEHQLATARHFMTLNGVTVALDEGDLIRRLDEVHQVPAAEVTPFAQPALIAAIHDFIHGRDGRSR